MKTNKRYLKVFVLSLGLAAGLLLPVSATAQKEGGGIFGYGNGSNAETQYDGVFGVRSLDGGYSISTEQFGAITPEGFVIGTEQFGQNTPLGSGLLIMAAAGAVYAFRKRKKNN